MFIRIAERLEQIPAAQWNALVGERNPFLRHEFLASLEATRCVTPDTGWQPQHLVIYQDGPFRGRLLGAVPMYRKDHSYGEYVFDWAWANAYARAGEHYYPKLVAGVPFTPATGPRLLVAPGADPAVIRPELVRAAWQHAQDTGASSLHWLFVPREEAGWLARNDHLLRTGFQFHWSNPGYRDFDDFLSGFTAEKRKKIKRERRQVREAGIVLETLTGDGITGAHWDAFHDFYLSTIRAHGAHAYLSRDFFHRLGETLRDRIVLVLARKDRDYVAGALNLRGSDTLYGRYWGCRGNYPGLHFETCYYTPIQYGIGEGLRTFEAGAQGEHKLARGFVPVETHSAHRLSHPGFRHAVADYLARETRDVEACVCELREHAPFKKTAMTES